MHVLTILNSSKFDIVKRGDGQSVCCLLLDTRELERGSCTSRQRVFVPFCVPMSSWCQLRRRTTPNVSCACCRLLVQSLWRSSRADCSYRTPYMYNRHCLKIIWIIRMYNTTMVKCSNQTHECVCPLPDPCRTHSHTGVRRNRTSVSCPGAMVWPRALAPWTMVNTWRRGCLDTCTFDGLQR